MARELAALRLSIGESVTREYLRRELDDLRALLADLQPNNPMTPTQSRSEAQGPRANH